MPKCVCFWTSDEYKTEGNKKFYHSFSRTTEDEFLFGVSLNDYVIINHKYIGQVNQLFSLTKKNHQQQQYYVNQANIKLFFRPKQTSQGKKPFHGKTEIFPSDITINIPISKITGTVSENKLKK